MTPMASGDEINATPEVVIPIVLVAMTVALLAYVLRRFLVAAVDELAELARTYGAVASRKFLDHRPGRPVAPWFCGRCSSHNTLTASRCYRCGAHREESELTLPGGEEPVGASAGRAQRNQRRG